MALVGTATNRTNIDLPVDVSSAIIEKMQEESAVMTLARQIELPGRGAAINVITSDPVAGWVGETVAKPVSNPGLETKIMRAYKLAVIIPFSNEFRRDAGALYDAIVARIPRALGQKFDATVIGSTAPGTDFDVFGSTATVDVKTDPYEGLIDGVSKIAVRGGVMNGVALSPQGNSTLLGAVDGNKRPLFINNVSEGAIPMILGARTVTSSGMYEKVDDVAYLGVMGDWSQAVYGTVEGVKIDYSSDATLVNGGTTINLFQQNMFAVRAEIEIGFRANTDVFCRLEYSMA